MEDVKRKKMKKDKVNASEVSACLSSEYCTEEGFGDMGTPVANPAGSHRHEFEDSNDKKKKKKKRKTAESNVGLQKDENDTRKKDKVNASEVSASFLLEKCTEEGLGDMGTSVANYEGSRHDGCEDSNDEKKKKKKKRKRADSRVRLQEDENDTRKKDKVNASEVSASLLSEYCTEEGLGDMGTPVANYEGSHHDKREGSNDKKKKKKKRKTADSSVGLPKDENDTRKNVKQALSAEEKKIVEAVNAGMPSSMPASCKKEKRRTEKEMEPAGKVKLSSEGIPYSKVNDDGETVRKGIVASKDMVSGEVSSVRKDRPSARKDKSTADAKSSQSKEKKRRVRFSGEVEVFPPANDTEDAESGGLNENHLVRGKRFTLEEDAKILEAIDKYIEVNQLGEEGKHMIKNCRKYPQVYDCWKKIAACIPYRPYLAVRYRAHVLLERSDKREWTPEEYEILQRFHEKHGAKWKILAERLGKYRLHVKDAWRRIKNPNMKRGRWSQDEYQTLFDLVNMDLRMNAFQEKNDKHGMIRDNISWGAISDKISTRLSQECCTKWYKQLTSSLVTEGVWTDTDDYRLLDVLQNLDACCLEEVDWDNLLQHRSGEVCRKRWNQMVRHIGAHQEAPFLEQLDVLLKRYSPDMLEYREHEG